MFALSRKIKQHVAFAMAATMVAMTGIAFAGDDINEVRAALAEELGRRPAPAQIASSPSLLSTASSVTDLGDGYKRYIWNATGSDLGVVKAKGETIVVSFPVDVHFSEIRLVSIDAEAWDVDYPEDTEHDVVYFNGSSIGRLHGGNNSSHLNQFKALSPDLVKIPEVTDEVAQNTFSVRVDVGNEGWVTAINWAKLTIEGKEELEVDASDGTETDGILVTWNEVAGVSSFHITRRKVDGGEEKDLGTVSGTEYMDDDEELDPNEEYSYTVEAMKGASTSGMVPLGLISFLSGTDEGYFDNNVPQVTGMEVAPLFLEGKGPYNVKLIWNDYDEEKFAVEEVKFTFTFVEGGKSGKQAKATWGSLKGKSKAELSEETDLSANGLSCGEAAHGKYKAKIEWTGYDKKKGRSFTKFKEKGKARKKLELELDEGCKVYFEKWGGGPGDAHNWWKYWKDDGAITHFEGFQHECVVTFNGKPALGTYGPHAYNARTLGGDWLKSMETIRQGEQVISQQEKYWCYLPAIERHSLVDGPLKVGDLAAATQTQISINGGTIGVDAEGVEALGVVLKHELTHQDTAKRLHDGRYFLGAGTNLSTIDIDKIREYMNSVTLDAQSIETLNEYISVVENARRDPKFLASDNDGDEVEDNQEKDYGLRAGKNSRGVGGSYGDKGDNEFVSRSEEHKGIGYANTKKDWAYPGNGISKSHMGDTSDDWNSVESTETAKLQKVGGEGSGASAQAAGRRGMLSATDGDEDLRRYGAVLSLDWQAEREDYADTLEILGAEPGNASGDGGNGFNELSFTVNVSNRMERSGYFSFTGYLVDAGGKGVSKAQAGATLDSGLGQVSLRFAGQYIYVSHRNGYTLKLVEAANADTDVLTGAGAKNDLATTTRAYTYNEFAHDAVEIGSGISETLDGRDLKITVPLELDGAGEYVAEATILDEGGNFVAAAKTSFAAGAESVVFSFPGDDIYASAREGKFRIYSIIVKDASGGTVKRVWDAYETAEYTRRQFAPSELPIVVNEASFDCEATYLDDGVTIDALKMTFTVNNSGAEALGYRIEANITGTNGMFAAASSAYVTLEPGENEVALNVASARLKENGVEGPYSVRDVFLVPTGDKGNTERFFPSVEAVEAPIEFLADSTFTAGEARVRTSETGDYVCAIAVPVTVGRPVTLTLSVMLVDANGKIVATGKTVKNYDEACDDVMEYRFSTGDVQAAGLKGPYTIRFAEISCDIDGVSPVRLNVPDEGEVIERRYTRYVDCYNSGSVTDGYSWDTAFADIQSAVDAANDGDLILVADGSYGPFETYNKSIEIRSVNGWTETTIDASGSKRCATLGRDEASTNTVLVGFTLVDGDATTDDTLTLWNCGGGVCGGTVRNCRITFCTASKGGGAYYSWMENCLIDHNTASTYGGGTYGCVAVNCTIANNRVDSYYSSHGGGVYLGSYLNSIIYNNYYDESSTGNYAECQMYYCSTYPLPSSGEGNITADPYFKDAANDDYRLERRSACIDAGFTSLAPGDCDLNGGVRICDGVVDLGALEFQTHTYSDGECGFREFDVDGREGETLSIPVWGGHPDRASSVKVYVVPCTATLADLNLGKTKPPLVIKWKVGEVGTKSVKIPLKADSVAEGAETLSLVLGAPSGITLTENRAIKITIKDATSNVTLAEALNNAKLKPSSSGAGKWKPVEGLRAYPNEKHQRDFFAESPAMKKGKVSTLTVGTFKGKGKLYFRFMFSGDESKYSSKTKFQAFAGKAKYEAHTAASSSSGWNSYYLDLGKGTHKVYFKVTQGAATFARVRVTDIAWIPDGKTMTSTGAYCWPETGGVVVGGGRYPTNTLLTLKAKVRPGWRLRGWYRMSDWAEVGTAATLKVTASGNASYYAIFSELNTIRTLPYPAEGGTTTGGGFYTYGKSATLKAVPAKNYYLEGWYRADEGDPNKMPVDSLCSSYGNANPLAIFAYGNETYFAKFLPCPKLTLKTDNAKGGSVKGTGQYQPGKTATLVATPKKGYAFTGWYDEDGNLLSLAATYKYKMTAAGVSFTARFKKESELAKPTLTWGDYVVGGDVEGTSSTALTAGVVYAAQLTVQGESVVSITKVAGLPKGLTYKSGKVSGVPTKAGSATVTVTVALASNKKKVWTYRVRLNVAALPAFARGTFYGWSYYYDESVEGGTVDVRKVTVSVTSAGKISAVVGSLKFSGTGWTVDDDEFGWYRAKLRAVRTVGSGKKAKKYTDVLTFWLDPDADWMSNQLQGYVASFSGNITLDRALERLEEGSASPVPLNADTNVSARRNPFGDNAEAKETLAAVRESAPTSFTDGDGTVWKFSVSDKGVATISRTTGTGKNKKTTSATAVVEIDSDSNGNFITKARFAIGGNYIGGLVWGPPSP